MIDAGSSGCRAHVFRYAQFAENGQIYLVPKHASFKAKPGLSSFASNPEAAGASLEPLIKFVKSIVPEEEWKLTPLWLKATAGLRMVSEQQRNQILDSVRAFLMDKSKSPFITRPKFVEVIPGHEEGAYGWISVNYLYKYIGPHKLRHIDEPYAVIEMGGASTQVTQQALSHDSSNDIPPDYKYTFTLGDNSKITVYTYSYLGMGSEQAREKLNNALVAKARHEAEKRGGSAPSMLDEVHDPCLNRGFRRSKGTERKDVYEGAGGNFHVVGSASGADSCVKAITSVLIEPQKSMSCKHQKPPYTMGCVHQPDFVKHSSNILVFENFFYAASGAGTLPADHEEAQVSTGIFPLLTSSKEFVDSANEICRPNWKDLQEIAPKDNQPKDAAAKLCFSLSYASAFIDYGLGIDANKKIMVQKEIFGTDIEWALGAAYIEALAFTKNRRQYLRGTIFD
jgi:Golgi nucleoside diphosphatase